MHDGALMDAVGERWRFTLKRRWPANTAKEAARAFDVDERTVERWLAGAAPRTAVLLRAARQWGWSFLAEVMEPAAGPAPSDLQAGIEIAAIRHRLDALDQRIRAEG